MPSSVYPFPPDTSEKRCTRAKFSNYSRDGRKNSALSKGIGISTSFPHAQDTMTVVSAPSFAGINGVLDHQPVAVGEIFIVTPTLLGHGVGFRFTVDGDNHGSQSQEK